MRRMDIQKEHEIDTRKSVRYFVEEKHRDRNIYVALYPHMLIEDLHLGIMPIGGRSRNPKFKVTIAPQDSTAEKLILNGLPTRHGQPYNLSEAISDFIDETAQILAYYGKAYYEIVFYYKRDDLDKPLLFTLDRISNDNIHSVFGFSWQFLPKSLMQDNEYNNKRFIRLPRNTVVCIKLPDKNRGSRGQMNLLSKLAWLSKDTIPKFTMADMANQKQQPGYNFLTYKRNRDIYLGKITRHLGWPVRSLLNDQTLEFYQLYRYLKFEQSKALMREIILNKLNKVLKIIGNKMNFDAEIKIEGLPSSTELEVYMKKLSSGDLRFSEIVNVLKV